MSWHETPVISLDCSFTCIRRVHQYLVTSRRTCEQHERLKKNSSSDNPSCKTITTASHPSYPVSIPGTTSLPHRTGRHSPQPRAPSALRILARAIISTTISGQRSPSPRTGDILLLPFTSSLTREGSLVYYSLRTSATRQSGISVSEAANSLLHSVWPRTVTPSFGVFLGYDTTFRDTDSHRFLPFSTTCGQQRRELRDIIQRWKLVVRAPLRVHVSARADSRAYI